MSEQVTLIGLYGTQRGWGAMSRAGLPSNKVRCADGFTLSVVAGAGSYCSPRPGWIHPEIPEDYAGPYYEVEVGYPSERPEPWSDWSKWVEDPDSPTETVYGYVPIGAVQALVELHGGAA